MVFDIVVCLNWFIQWKQVLQRKKLIQKKQIKFSKSKKRHICGLRNFWKNILCYIKFFTGLRYYKEALEKNPLDANFLFKRANAYGKLFQMQKGLADVDRMAKIDPTNIRGVIRRVKFLYLNGEFEKCFVLSFNHMKIRKQPPYFALGCRTVSKCN